MEKTPLKTKTLLITIPNYRAKSRNQTNKKHWTNYHRHRTEVMELVRVYCKKPRTFECAKVTISAFYKGKRSIDPSNLDDKIFIDSLMRVGILKDDTIQENPVVVKQGFRECGFDKVVIKVEDYT